MNMVIKVADFGLSVNTKDKEYYRLASGDMEIKLPFRWMAPETFSDYIFSEKSDVVRSTIIAWLIMIDFIPILPPPWVHIPPVEFWSNMLGDFHRRPSSL